MFIGVVPPVLCCQHKMDFREVDRKEAWQTVGLLVANNFSGEHKGKLVHTQLSARGLAHCTPTEQNCSWKPAPPGETHSMNLLLGAAQRPASVHISILFLNEHMLA